MRIFSKLVKLLQWVKLCCYLFILWEISDTIKTRYMVCYDATLDFVATCVWYHYLTVTALIDYLISIRVYGWQC